MSGRGKSRDISGLAGLVAKGMTKKELAAFYGVSTRTIKRWCDESGGLTPAAPVVPLQHGKRSAYNRGCRCPECQEANLLHKREYRARVQAEGREPRTHGYGGYTNWGCRCEVCKAAGREANKRLAERVRTGKVQHIHGGVLEGCPCDECKANIVAVRRERYLRKKATA